MVIINPLPAHRVSAVQTLTRSILYWSPRVFRRTTRWRGITLGYGYLMMIITTKSGPIMFCILSLPFSPSCFASMVLIRDTVSCWRPFGLSPVGPWSPHPFVHSALPHHLLHTHTHSLSVCLLAATFVYFLVPPIYTYFHYRLPLFCVPLNLSAIPFLFSSFPVVSPLPPSPLVPPTLILSRLSLYCVLTCGRGIYIYTFSSYPFSPARGAYTWSFDVPSIST